MTVGVAAAAVVALLGGPAAAAFAAPTSAPSSAPVTAPTPNEGPIAGGTHVTVPGPPGVTFTALSSGSLHTLGLGTDGNAYSWGYNYEGQLGNGTNARAATPVRVAAPDGVVFTVLDAGGSFSVGLADDGSVYAWGEGVEGQIGNGTTANVNVPTRVELPGDVRAVQVDAGEYNVLALGTDGQVYGWGKNSHGQLGLGDGATAWKQLVPALTQTPTGVTFSSISTGSYHSLALTADGQAYAWGNNTQLELGQTGVNRINVPTPVPMPSGVRYSQVSAGGAYSTGIGDDGAIYSWGSNFDGQLGNDTTVGSVVPVKAHAPNGVTFVAAEASGFRPQNEGTRAEAGGYHTVAIGSDGATYAWGRNSEGQLGTGTLDDSNIPVPVKTPAGVAFVQAGAGTFSSVGLTPEGYAYGWGYNPLGQVGNPAGAKPFVLEPLRVAMDTEVTGITFDGLDGTELTPVGDGTWAVVTPAHAAGPVDVVVSWKQLSRDRSPIVFADGYTYLAPSVGVTGTKLVAGVVSGAATLPAADPSNWEITATAGSDVRVLSGTGSAALEREKTYTLGERLSATADPAAQLDRYLQRGDISCVDGAGETLPATVFGPAAGTLTLPAENPGISLAEPIACELTNQTAHASLVTRIGDGSTAAPAAGWGLQLDHADDTFDVQLSGAAVANVALPASYKLAAAAPAGVSVTGIERLSLDTAECVDAALDPASAPGSCWVKVSGNATAADVSLPQGAHSVFRVTAAKNTVTPPEKPDTGKQGKPDKPDTGKPDKPETGKPEQPTPDTELATTGGATQWPLLAAAAALLLGGLAVWVASRRPVSAAE